MASSMTGNISPRGRSSLIQISRRDNLPLILAFQGLALFVFALFLGTPTSIVNGEVAFKAGAIPANQLARPVSDSLVPTDLLPEQIQLPEFPNPDELARDRQLSPPTEERQEAQSSSFSLAALRVDTAGFQSPAPVQVALAPPDAPDQLATGTISQSRFGDGAGRRGLKGRDGGWGGVGVGGVGIGRVGGGTCGRNPAGPNVIVERRTGFPR
jgi:hypothetical protein